MSDANIKVGFSIDADTVYQIDRIAALQRWDKSTVVEVAIEALHKKLFSQPNPFVEVHEAITASAQVMGRAE